MQIKERDDIVISDKRKSSNLIICDDIVICNADKRKSRNLIIGDDIVICNADKRKTVVI